MFDLTGTAQRNSIRILALLVASVLLIPVSATAQDEDTPTTTSAPTEQQSPAAPALPAEPTPTPMPTPTPSPTADASTEDLGSVGDVAPVPPTAPALPQEEQPATGVVQAEGGSAEEVAIVPVVPADPGAAEAVEAADGAAPAIAPPPITTYGPQVVPSLGTATAPNTNTYTGVPGGFVPPTVLAPEVASGPQAAPGTPVTGSSSTDGSVQASGATSLTTPQTGIAVAIQPVSNVAAASLSIVQPSWFATAFAMVIMLVAASYGAMLRRRGEVVPEALDFSRAIRPRDASVLAVRSVRPLDLDEGQVSSVRP
ncbi:hypothetical protein [Euzebya tangerina]|uniref:hypothetical protein n=1 Tax=Euzebya tangerina TaxID=591198 RepID=UPI000E30BD18|nr:hypothetical protein [Euzebya tangerina]